MRYRIYYKRFDTDETKSEFQADSDELAVQEFEKRSANPSNAWDDMKLMRIDQVEKTTKITHNANYQRSLDRD